MPYRWSKALFLLPLMLLIGCSTTPERVDPYTPPEYAEPDPQCRDVAGRYLARPHPLAEGERDQRPLLALTLLPSGRRLEQATEVELMVEQSGALQVLAYDERGALLAKQRHAAQSGIFECDEGQLSVYPRKLGEPAGVQWNSVVVRKTVDGSLMLRKGGLFSGLFFLVVPMAVSAEDFYLFKPAP